MITQLMEVLVIRGAVNFRVQALDVAPAVAEQPLALAFARADLTLAPNADTTNLWHQGVRLNIIEKILLPKLDENHTQEQLIAHILQKEQQNTLEFKHKEGHRLTDPQALQEAAAEHVGNALRALRYNALLINPR
ncbi:hypothetical protein LT85_3480 [Collimonas arenae]|uniref:PKMT C-terminal winged helix domain-containing protein n=1 Tax=Collimonas arenae TaxID=279058 RepID=A0A0A1FD09_9BURK|nr:hypothetical protein [Collimonas arenae]AIY42638.1 hypothetical protein LT85_3480 [Collimonas arenae]